MEEGALLTIMNSLRSTLKSLAHKSATTPTSYICKGSQVKVSGHSRKTSLISVFATAPMLTLSSFFLIKGETRSLYLAMPVPTILFVASLVSSPSCF